MNTQKLSLGPWLWSPKVDLLAFAGTATFALTLVLLREPLGISGPMLPEWGWLAFILLIDVAHVYSTLYRTYFDEVEVRAHRLRYWGVPALVYVALVGLMALGNGWFWRVLAYVAVFHFVRQQVGWAALYRARAKQGKLDLWIDSAALYSATLAPVVYWHARLDEVRFYWFVPGDFVSHQVFEGMAPVAWGIEGLALAVFVARQAWLVVKRAELQLGKITVVFATAATWFVGIALTNSDFDFTVTNVIVHGVPYLVLIWMYSAARAKEPAPSLTSRVMETGWVGFLGVLFVLAYVEEWGWSRWVDGEHRWLFPGMGAPLENSWLLWVVPLLALPQVTHYVLDGVLWRRRDTRQVKAQRIALGMTGS